MNKRSLLGVLTTLPFLATVAKAGEAKSGTYTVPENVKKIRVRSFIGEKEVLDTNFRVVPGQTFKIDAIEE